MGVLYFKEFLLNSRFKHIIIYLLTFLAIYFIVITALTTKTYDLKEGDIAKVSIRAQRDIKDELTTKRNIDEAMSLVSPQYTMKPEVKESALNDVFNLFAKAEQLKGNNKDIKEKISELSKASNIKLSDDEFQGLLEMNSDELKNLQSFINKTIQDIFNAGIQYNSELGDTFNNENIKKAQDLVQMNFNTTSFSKKTRDLGTSIGVKLIKANSFYDKDKTEEMKSEAAKKIPVVMIKKDQIIVSEGKQVTGEEYKLLENLGLLNTKSKSEWYVYLSLAVIIALILSLEVFYLNRYQSEVYNDYRKLILINIINSISLILARTLSMVSPFLIPLAFAPMLLTLLLNRRISLTISVINVILISGAVNFSADVTIIALLNVVIGAIAIQKLQQRNDILYSCIYISVINVVATLALGFLFSNNASDVALKSLYVLIGSGLSGILTIGFLPFFESTFDIVTTIKLLELSNPNSPLLKKLLIEAPGTYHHSVMVANLAEVAAEAVGGNPVLARVSSYYHDIGKIKRPYFFKENQIGADNPHNKITPNLSALIIISHVKDGLELAKEYRIPKIIQDIIEQHHGTSLVKYFYVTAKNQSESPDSIIEEDFMYAGPIPSTKESGIIMLADSVEASVRSISDPSQSKIEDMVNNIIKGRLNDGQLDDCDLTLKDLSQIKAAFLKTLSGIYHHRIEYPVDKWEIKKDNKAEARL